MFARWSQIVVVTSSLLLPTGSSAHDGPDPIAHWNFDGQSVDGDQLVARLGPNGTINGELKVAKDIEGESLRFQRNASVTVSKLSDLKDRLPTHHLTISTWISVERPLEWGGIVSALQDNGDAEKGWVLGYNKQYFYFGLASAGADDGNGMMTYLSGTTNYEPGKLYQVVGTYDGKKMAIYVNGKLDAESTDQSGALLYPRQGEMVLGAYRDRNEDFPHTGRIREIAVYDEAATAKWVAQSFERQQQLAKLPAELGRKTGSLSFAIQPYLQYATQTSITVMWRTNSDAKGYVLYGEDSNVQHKAFASEGEVSVHEVTIKGLKPNTQYFYETISESSQGELASETRTFQTACGPDTPIAFAIISDTQDNPVVAKQIAEMAWAQRPHFVLHPGDLVGIGGKATDWTDEFFPSMSPLISRVCLYPVLGNHEGDAKFYYDYMSLPNPEYYYSFKYGNAEFFMVDSNRKLNPGSEQYKWLEEKLAASQATWKFVTHHHPPYSSDENDYGDLWSTNKSTRGDLRIRETCELYDKYNVDIVWNGHIHSYERTWPLRDHKPTDEGGTVYMIAGGGGGGLETPGPYRPAFQNNVKHGHHYCMAFINGGTLELKAFDLEGRLFDQVAFKKGEQREPNKTITVSR